MSGWWHQKWWYYMWYYAWLLLSMPRLSNVCRNARSRQMGRRVVSLCAALLTASVVVLPSNGDALMILLPTMLSYYPRLSLPSPICLLLFVYVYLCLYFTSFSTKYHESVYRTPLWRVRTLTASSRRTSEIFGRRCCCSWGLAICERVLSASALLKRSCCVTWETWAADIGRRVFMD